MLTVRVPPDTIAPSTDAGLDHSHVHPPSEERRRPGRPEAVSPHLLSLLRPAVIAPATRSPPLSKSRANDPLRDLGTSVGIVVAISLCALFWAVVGLVVSAGH